MMGNAPERIWASETDLGERWWQNDHYEPSTEYVRADLARAPRVKPLDLSNVLRHAFLSGVVAARGIPGHEVIDGRNLWVDYEPYEPGSYDRILAALEPAPAPSWQPFETMPPGVVVDIWVTGVGRVTDTKHGGAYEGVTHWMHPPAPPEAS